MRKTKIIWLLVVCFFSVLFGGRAFAVESCLLDVRLEQEGVAETVTVQGLTGDMPLLLLRDFSQLTNVYVHWFPDSGAIGWTAGQQAVFTHPRGRFIYVVDCQPVYEEIPEQAVQPVPEIKAFVPSDVIETPVPEDPAAYGEEGYAEATPENIAETAEDGLETPPLEDEEPGDMGEPAPEPEPAAPAIIGWTYQVKKETLPTPLLVEKDKTYIHSSLLPYFGYTGVWSEPKNQYEIVKTVRGQGIVTPPLEEAYAQVKSALVKDLPAEKQVFGHYKTSFNANERNRTINLKLAAAAINGQVIQPGKTFSFNKTVGPRTKERGYLDATIFVDGKKEQGLGGGICQVSSTLYNAVLNSKLKVVERHTHSLPVTYVPTGKDATVSYGYLDFRFQNNQKYPVKIQASVHKNTLDIAFVSVDK